MSESKNKKHTEIRFSQTPSSNAVNSMPEDSYDIINKYGRCNIQPTNDTDNEFPEIAQGRPESKKDAEFDKYDVEKLREKQQS